MAPQRRYRKARFRHWVRGNGRRIGQDSIAGEKTRRVLDSYCPYCATDIRSAGPRRIRRCPNTALCGKSLPMDDCCPNCSHYTRPGDNFCRVCRTNLRSVVRGRGGLYQQLRRVPSPIVSPSPAREEIAVNEASGGNNTNNNESDNDSDNGGGRNFNFFSDSDNESDDHLVNIPIRNPLVRGGNNGGGGANPVAGFLRIARIDDD